MYSECVLSCRILSYLPRVTTIAPTRRCCALASISCPCTRSWPGSSARCWSRSRIHFAYIRYSRHVRSDIILPILIPRPPLLSTDTSCWRRTRGLGSTFSTKCQYTLSRLRSSISRLRSGRRSTPFAGGRTRRISSTPRSCPLSNFLGMLH